MSTGIGDRLRDAREQMGRSLEEAARDTRVRDEYLRALENEEFGVFGGDVYAKGFLSTYARYLDLDPAPLLEAYRRDVQRGGEEATEQLASGAVASAGRTGLPAWVTWGVAAVVVLGGIMALGQLVGGRTPGPAQPDGQAPPQPVASPTGTVPPSPASAASPSPSLSPSPTFEGVNLVLAVEEACWMEVTIDEEVVFSDTVEAGETKSWEAPDEVTILYGNPGGVRAELNGRDLGIVAGGGQPETVTYTPEGVEGAAETATPAATEAP